MKARSLFAMFLVLSLMGTHAVFAVDHGSIAIHGELGGNGSSSEWDYDRGTDIWLLRGIGRTDDPSARIGVRIFLTQDIALDANFGCSFISEVESDTESKTFSEPGATSIFFQGGIVYEAVKTERATLNVLARFGITLRSWHDNTSQYGSYGYNKYESYNVMIPSFTLAVEPSYFFTDNISVFANFGVMLRIIPNSKYVNFDDPDYDWTKNNFPLKDNKDGKTQFGTTGILIGFRFYVN